MDSLLSVGRGNGSEFGVRRRKIIGLAIEYFGQIKKSPPLGQ